MPLVWNVITCPINVRAEVSYHLIEPAQAFRSQERQHRIGVLFGVPGINQLADAPGGQAYVVHGLTELM